MITTTGFDDLEDKLKMLSGAEVRRATREAMRAATRVVATAIKSNIPAKHKEVRKAIGSRVFTDGGQIHGKAGGAVGQKFERQDKAAKKGRGNKPGVGISANNIHWYLMGTADRYTGEQTIRNRRTGQVTGKRKTGKARRFTGRMPKHPAVELGFQQSEGEAASRLKNGFMEGVNRIAAKK